MIYFTTGANGAGKTLVTLEDVRKQQLKELRPVYYFGFDMHEAKAAEFGWQKFDPKEWQALPDGSICIMDECQDYFGAHCFGKDLPDYVTQMAISRRKRGFDFWMIAPHPTLLHIFIRRLIDKPSWHRHIKRTFGADMVSVLSFASPDLKCEEPGAGARGEVTMRAYPKHVYDWYKSASLHTGKKKIPKAVYFLAVAALAVPAMIWGVFETMRPDPDKIVKTLGVQPTVATGSARGVEKAKVMTPEEYATAYTARFEGLPHTAPIYDSVTTPVVAPYPAACIVMGKRCGCYSQQGTKLPTPVELCVTIAQNGFFIAWNQNKDETPKGRDVTAPPATRPADIQLITAKRVLAERPSY